MKLFKKVFSLIQTGLPHLNLSMSLVFLTLLVTDQLNRALAFINNNITKGMLFAWCILVFAQSLGTIWKHRRGK